MAPPRAEQNCDECPAQAHQDNLGFSVEAAALSLFVPERSVAEETCRVPCAAVGKPFNPIRVSVCSSEK